MFQWEELLLVGSIFKITLWKLSQVVKTVWRGRSKGSSTLMGLAEHCWITSMWSKKKRFLRQKFWSKILHFTKRIRAALSYIDLVVLVLIWSNYSGSLAWAEWKSQKVVTAWPTVMNYGIIFLIQQKILFIDQCDWSGQCFHLSLTRDKDIDIEYRRL